MALHVTRKVPSGRIYLHVTKAYAIKFAGHGCLFLNGLLNEGWGSLLWSATPTLEVKTRKDLFRIRIKETGQDMGKQSHSRQHSMNKKRILSKFQMVAEKGK